MTEPDSLPSVVTVTQSFASRLPTQRVIDVVERTEGAFADVVQRQPMRVVAFRALLRDHPGYDITAVWMHSYDVEVEIEAADPTNSNGQTPAPPSVTFGAFP